MLAKPSKRRRLLDGPHPLRLWREAQGLSQGDLHKMSGVNAVTISSIEGGTRRALGDVLERLMHATGLPADAFVRPKEFMRDHPDYQRSLPPPTPIRRGRPRKPPEGNGWPRG